MRDALLVADALDPVDDIVGVFLERVVDRREGVALRSLVVHPETTTDVDVLQGDTGLHQLAEDVAGLGDRPLHHGDAGDLRADVEVQQLGAVEDALLPDVLDGVRQLVDPQPELGGVASGLGPATGPLGGELHPEAEDRPQAHLLRETDQPEQL